MDINRGNRFDYLVSMSADGTRGNRSADINTSLIRTVNGQTITLYFDTQLPRPYDLIYRVQGTGGICMATTDKIYIEGRSPQLLREEIRAPDSHRQGIGASVKSPEPID